MKASPFSKQARAQLLSVVLPAFREASGIERMLAVLEDTLSGMNIPFEVIVVDDGSPDATFEVVSGLCESRRWLRCLRLSRNFGKEAAILAGLAAARGDAVITMDADLQHPPEIIPKMLAVWESGAKVVNAVKSDRSVDNRWYASVAHSITGLLSRMTGISLQSASDFKLLDRQVVDILVNSLPERERFFRGLSRWVGFRQVDLPFKVAASTRDERNWTLGALMRLTATALVSFTGAPLQLITGLGMLTLLLAGVVGTEAFMSWLAGNAVSGFTTLILTLLIIGSFIMISLGILGAYIANIYEEIKGRPAYLIAESRGGSPARDRAIAPEVFLLGGVSHSRRARSPVLAKGPEMIDGKVPEKDHARYRDLRH